MEARTYLDTHVIVWLYDGEIGKFTPKAADIVESHPLYASEFVRLELKYLEAIGRLRISPDTIIRFLADEIGLSMCTLPLGPIITEAMGLSWTRDPFDRLITANASYYNSPLLTRDETILTNYTGACF
jgi:PIN domain nuclease of toxin-antitoxin system